MTVSRYDSAQSDPGRRADRHDCLGSQPQYKRKPKAFAAAVLILKALGLIFALGACIVFFVYHTPLFYYFFR